MIAVCASHSPLMLTDIEHTDAQRQEDFRAAMARAARMIDAYAPELVVVFGPDHFNGLFFDLMPAFCVGVQAQSTEDWGLAPGMLDVPRELAMDCVRALHAGGFDVAYSHRLKVDHGITIPLHQLAGGLARYPVLPIVVNCAADPRPSFARTRALGEAVGAFLARTGKRVAIIGSGGLSHDPPTPRIAGSAPHVAARLIDRHTPTAEDLQLRQARVMSAARALVAGQGPCQQPSEHFDRQFLAHAVAQDFAALGAYADASIDREAGFGGHEVRCWVAALAALCAAGPAEVTLRYYAIVPEWITGMGVIEARHLDEKPLATGQADPAAKAAA
jgi:2,3-dihydroxyphenylpropionate 1,2-dioxygenase